MPSGSVMAAPAPGSRHPEAGDIPRPGARGPQIPARTAASRTFWLAMKTGLDAKERWGLPLMSAWVRWEASRTHVKGQGGNLGRP